MIESIKICSNKLYVNWINVTPYTLKNYELSSLYKKTIKHFSVMKSKPDVFFENYKIFNNTKKGLWIGDFFNNIVNNYYYNIKDIKFYILSILY